ncbi:MAG TPA: hypothetical protein VEA58_03685, partial [Anaerovoracaceae bacterium]|nr:hypothetical protein [Anaerovoracaceae bacterium]
NLEQQGKMIYTILRESGTDTKAIQTFENLWRAVWQATGFSSLMRWIHQHPDAKRLIESSGKKWLIEEMKVLGSGVFTGDVLGDSLEESRQMVDKLKGWFSLVKIFWTITTTKNKRFINIASIENDTIVWKETITCATLIFQVALDTTKLYFSIDDVIQFCEATKQPNWLADMKMTFVQLAVGYEAPSAIPIFHRYIDFFQEKSTNAFFIANEVVLGTGIEREYVDIVRTKANDFKQEFMMEVGRTRMHKQDLKDKLGLYLRMYIGHLPGMSKYNSLADEYFTQLLKSIETPKFEAGFDFSKLSATDIGLEEGDEFNLDDINWDLNTDDPNSNEINEDAESGS